MVLIFSTQNSDVAAAPCVICRQENTLGGVRAVSLYASGKQAVACVQHLPHNTRDWVLAWVAFETIEQVSRVWA